MWATAANPDPRRLILSGYQALSRDILRGRGAPTQSSGNLNNFTQRPWVSPRAGVCTVSMATHTQQAPRRLSVNPYLFHSRMFKISIRNVWLAELTHGTIFRMKIYERCFSSSWGDTCKPLSTQNIIIIKCMGLFEGVHRLRYVSTQKMHWGWISATITPNFCLVSVELTELYILNWVDSKR